MKQLLVRLKCLIGRKIWLLWSRKSGNTCNNILIIRYIPVSVLNDFHMDMEEKAKGNFTSISNQSQAVKNLLSEEVYKKVKGRKMNMKNQVVCFFWYDSIFSFIYTCSISLLFPGVLKHAFLVGAGVPKSCRLHARYETWCSDKNG